MCFNFLPHSVALHLSGRIVDAETGLGIEGVTISLSDNSSGTVSDKDGKYLWNVPSSGRNDSVYITHLGYRTIGRVILELENGKFMLSPEFYNIKEVDFKGKKPRKKRYNAFSIRRYGEKRESIPDLEERQNDIIGKPFIKINKRGKYKRIRSVQIVQETERIKSFSYFRRSQNWRFRLRIIKADEFGNPTNEDLLSQRVIITVSDVKYEVYSTLNYGILKSTTENTNYDYSDKIYFGIIDIDLRKFDITYPETGVFVFVELLPPVFKGGKRVFRIAKFDVGNSGWMLNGRSRKWYKGYRTILTQQGKERKVNIEPAISLELTE